MRSSLVELGVNGKQREFIVRPGTSLLMALRETLGLTAAKRGCANGGCGACTVLLDGNPVPACLVAVETVDGSAVRTLEGTNREDGSLTELQAAFIDGFATQCGFCTPGMIMAAEALLVENPDPTREDVVRAISGNVCRCTGYAPIIDAVLDAAARRRQAALAQAGELRGDEQMPAELPPIDTSYFAAERAADLHVVGTSVPRVDALGFVTGRTQFFEDVIPQDLLHVKMHRSERHHAFLKKVDFSGALSVPGVIRVLTHENVPANWYTVLRLIGVEPNDQPALPEDRVLWKGEPICAIVAESEAAAIEGAARVQVQYEDLPAVLDMEQALADGATIIKPHGTNSFMYEGHPCRRIRFGDVEAGFAEADHVFEWTYASSPIEHATVETTGCVVVPQPDGRLRIYTNTQACFFTLDNTALILDIPYNKLQVVGGTVGGGFGGKVDVMVEPIACIAAMATGRPVRFVYSRAEEMQISSPRAAEHITIRDGVTADGRILARKVTSHMEAGAYSGHTPYATTKCAAHLPGPYTIPNVWVDAYCVYTNRTPTGPMRGFGVTIADFALETQMDRIARTLGIDPLELRLKNAYRDGDMKAHRKVVEGAALVEVIQRAARLVGHELPAPYLELTSLSREEEATV